MGSLPKKIELSSLLQKGKVLTVPHVLLYTPQQCEVNRATHFKRRQLILGVLPFTYLAAD